MYDHVISINSVTATVHEVMMKNGLLTEYLCQLQFYSVMFTRTWLWQIKYQQLCRGPSYKSLSLNLKSLSFNHKSLSYSILKSLTTTLVMSATVTSLTICISDLAIDVTLFRKCPSYAFSFHRQQSPDYTCMITDPAAPIQLSHFLKLQL